MTRYCFNFTKALHVSHKDQVSIHDKHQRIDVKIGA